MTDTDKQAPIEPITVTMVGTSRDSMQGDSGAPITTGSVAKTEDHQPNVIFNVIGPAKTIAVRFTWLYLTTLSGLLPAGPATGYITAPDFIHLFMKCSSLAVVPAIMGLVKDLVTVLGRYEQKHPLLTGSV